MILRGEKVTSVLFNPYTDPEREVAPRPVYIRGKPEESSPNAYLPLQISHRSPITLILTPCFTQTALVFTNVRVLFLLHPGYISFSSRVPLLSSWL